MIINYVIIKMYKSTHYYNVKQLEFIQEKSTRFEFCVRLGE